MRVPQFRIRTLMIAVAIAGIIASIAAGDGRIDYRHSALAALAAIGWVGAVILIIPWVYVLRDLLRPPDS